MNFCSSWPVALTSRAPVLQSIIPLTHSCVPTAAAVPSAQVKLSTPAVQKMIFFCWAGMVAGKALRRTQPSARQRRGLPHRARSRARCRSPLLGERRQPAATRHASPEGCCQAPHPTRPLPYGSSLHAGVLTSAGQQRGSQGVSEHPLCHSIRRV